MEKSTVEINLEKTMSLADLECLESLLSLPLPEPSSLSRNKPEDLARLAETCLDSWCGLLSGRKLVPGVGTTLRSDRGEYCCDHLDDPLFCRVICTLGIYCDHLIHSILDLGILAEQVLPPGFGHEQTGELIEILSQEPEAPLLVRAMRVFTLEYLSCLQFMRFYPVMRRENLPAGVLGCFETVAHEHVAKMHTIQPVAAGELRTMFFRLTNTCLGYMAQVYKQCWYSSHDSEYRPGVFSTLRLHELSLLARRDPAVVKEYGVKRVEKVFEQRLALLTQSLGFYVVSTRNAERTVDLVCISSDPREPLTAMIEAKSTTKAYSLPTKDERALLEYIDDIKRSLTTLPPLRFVLIVGHKAAKTLSPKLKRLEGIAGVPIRFCSAEVLMALREAIPGPIPMSFITREIVAANHILDDSFAKAAADDYFRVQDAHSALVKTLLAGRTGSSGNHCTWTTPTGEDCL
jgi:hypothetical protein